MIRSQSETFPEQSFSSKGRLKSNNFYCLFTAVSLFFNLASRRMKSNSEAVFVFPGCDTDAVIFAVVCLIQREISR